MRKGRASSVYPVGQLRERNVLRKLPDWAGEIERLNIQSKAVAPDTLAMLDRFGPIEGWARLDIGCGPGGITDLRSGRVWAAGRVIGLDMDEEFLEYARRSAMSCFSAATHTTLIYLLARSILRSDLVRSRVRCPLCTG
jgi:hypothetical protein